MTTSALSTWVDMLVRQLLIALLQHTEDGRRLDDEVLLKVGNETRTVDASYSDGTFILIARDPVP
jgi:hypothetical protein